MFLMIKILSLTISFAADTISFDDFFKNYPKLDPNVVKAFKDFQKATTDFSNNTNPEKDLDLYVYVFESRFCVNGFEKYLSDDVKRAYNLVESKSTKQDEERIRKVLTDAEKFKARLKGLAELRNDPLKLCHFKIDENSEIFAAEKKGLLNDKSEFKKITDLKSKSHPVVVKMINDLEKRKTYLLMGLDPNGNFGLEEKKYEKNFVKVFNFQLKYVENFCRKKMALMPAQCINDIKKNYQKNCKGNTKYTLDSAPVTEYLMCADDFSLKINGTCNYKLTFNLNESSEPVLSPF